MSDPASNGGSLAGHGVQNAFNVNASAWTEYVRSNGGELRHAVVLHHLRRYLAAAGGRSLRIMDAGGGTGEMAVELAALGHHVTLLDFSEPMLAVARSRCDELGAIIEIVCEDVWKAQSLWPPASFDAVLCHSLLEFTDEPAQLLGRLVALLKPEGTLSVVAGNRHALVMREAVVQGNAARAREGLDADIPANDLFGLPRRTFHPEEIRAMIEANGILIGGEYGVRIFCDLVRTVSDWGQMRELEVAASSRVPFNRLGRFTQFLGTRRGSDGKMTTT